MGEFYEPIPCDDFCAFVDKVQELQKDKSRRWVFKGLEKSCWPLKTTLERECERFGISGDDVQRREYNMIREFQRRLHHYETHVPRQENVDEWMALMQHYGAPTRLLDFTYSPFVAAYFAFEKAKSGNVSVWAVDGECIDRAFKSDNCCDQRLRDAYEEYANYRSPRAFCSLFLEDPGEKYVLVVNPFRLNDRLAYQQGLFLCPASVTAGFMENLGGLFKSSLDSTPVKKFIINVGEKGEHRDEALRDLHSMNINRLRFSLVWLDLRSPSTLGL